MTSEGALFDPLAELYERYAEINDGIYRPWLTQAVATAGPGGPQARAVDLGCGSGRFDGLLADRYGSVLAVDIAAREIELARARHARVNVTYAERSLLDVTPAADGRFDLVFSVNTLFHLPGPERVLAHVRDLVAPGSWAVLVDIVSGAGGAPTAPLLRRWSGVKEAGRTLRRRRSLSDAWLVLRLRQHRAWMRHTATNKPLTRDAFHILYGAAFPGCEFTDTIDPYVCAIRWQRPG
ncbi:MAG TPA: class I SAM-dependent methyltransferase [Mycobacteriales bacterium]|nr:class I SAM-dependent methyltransferase [Mycobacteriales bacterium]